MKLSPNIERVADEATNIAECARKLNKHPPLAEVNLIVPIQAHAISMLKDSRRICTRRCRAGAGRRQP
jgi:phosphate uptake regulator